jgi:enoyl-CoA hydratase/carnithine racemase
LSTYQTRRTSTGAAAPPAIQEPAAAMLAELDRATEAAGRDDGVRVIVLTGAGEKAFAAGADIKEFGKLVSGSTKVGDTFKLTSINYKKMSAEDKAKEPAVTRRTDGDYALSYIQRVGNGRLI